MATTNGDGNLNGKRVPQGFWPSCGNCAHFGGCKSGQPKHDGFGANGHTWHWAREAGTFGDGSMVIIKSWVGSSVMGEPHTGCAHYEVAQTTLLPLGANHAEYLTLAGAYAEVDAELWSIERGGDDTGERLSPETTELYEEGERLTAAMAALTA
jgi:hypothetical protein